VVFGTVASLVIRANESYDENPSANSHYMLHSTVPERPARRSRPPRSLRFDELEITRHAEDAVCCRVTLGAATDRLFVGEGTGALVKGGTANAAARAAVYALRAYSDVPFLLESCTKARLNGRVLMIALITIPTHPNQHLVGAVVVRGDESRAAALAVLDATNRWLEGRRTRHSAN
jgi:hypothetical protein